MPINLSVNDGGDFTPFIKYNAKAGRFYVRVEGRDGDVEVEKPGLAIDMARIRTGWIWYVEGAGPEKVWDPSPTLTAPKPQHGQFKRGFEVIVFGNEQTAAGKLGLREFSSTASNAISAILKMHAAYEEGMKANPGKVPYYKNTGVTPISGKYGTNYEPSFRLVGWVDRAKIPEFDNAEAHARVVAGNGAPPAERTPFDDPQVPIGNGGFPSGGPPKGHPADMDDEIPFNPW